MPDDRSDAQPKLIVAQYKGYCRGCGAQFFEGDKIYYDGTDNDGARTWEEDCLPNGQLEPGE